MSEPEGKRVKKKRMSLLSLQSKMQLLADVDTNIGSRKQIAAKYGIPSNTLSTIVKNREKIETASKIVFFQPDRKRMRESSYSEIDRQLFAWVKQAEFKNEIVNSITIAERAEYLAEQLGVESFRLNHGWIDRFKKRHGITFSKNKNTRLESSANNQTHTPAEHQSTFSQPGTSNQDEINEDLNLTSSNGDINRLTEITALPDDLGPIIASIFKPKRTENKTANEWSKNSLPYVLDEFQPADVFCANETDLFFRCIPDKLQSMNKGKGPRDKVTVLCGVNMNGIEKLPLLVIGKLPISNYSNIKNLPLEYVTEKTTALSQPVFESWLDQVDEKFHDDGRKIALILNVSPAHSSLSTRLKAIKLIFLPADTGDMLQPCSQGIIHSFKMHYRTNIVQKYLLHARNEISKGNYHCADSFNVSITNALYSMRVAWDQVEKETIVSSFRHAGFHAKENHPVVEEATESHLNHLLKRLGQLVPVATTANAFVDIDKDLTVLHQDFMSNNPLENDSSSASAFLPSPVTCNEAIKAVECLKQFAQERSMGEEFFRAISSIENLVDKSAVEEIAVIKVECEVDMDDNNV